MKLNDNRKKNEKRCYTVESAVKVTADNKIFRQCVQNPLFRAGISEGVNFFIQEKDTTTVCDSI